MSLSLQVIIWLWLKKTHIFGMWDSENRKDPAQLLLEQEEFLLRQ